MTKALEHALSELRNLPEADQDALAEAILAEIGSERDWLAAFAQSQDLLGNLADEALAEHGSGKTKALDPNRL